MAGEKKARTHKKAAPPTAPVHDGTATAAPVVSRQDEAPDTPVAEGDDIENDVDALIDLTRDHAMELAGTEVTPARVEALPTLLEAFRKARAGARKGKSAGDKKAKRDDEGTTAQRRAARRARAGSGSGAADSQVRRDGPSMEDTRPHTNQTRRLRAQLVASVTLAAWQSACSIGTFRVRGDAARDDAHDVVPEAVTPDAADVESLNPDSLYHLALRIDYPNADDRARAREDGRTQLGGDIMIHGSTGSVGCLAMGDEGAEDLFVLAGDVGFERLRVWIVPTDFRRNPAWQPREDLPA